MRLFWIYLNCLLLSACFTTRLEAPPNRDVRIMAAGEPAKFHKEYKDWYLLSGLLPIWRTDMADLIAKERLVEVRVQTEDRIADGVITLLTEELLLGVFPQSIVLEGNTAATRNRVIENPNPPSALPRKSESVTRPAETSGDPGGQAEKQPPGAPLTGIAGRTASEIPVNDPLR
jgi:hypothetical protein